MTESAGVLALDCGQTSITWSLIDDADTQTGSAKGVDTSRPVEPQIADAVRTILTLTGARPSTVAAGSTGMDRPKPEAVLHPLLDTSVSDVVLAHDATTSYLGALGDAPGVMIACGTGVVTLAVGPTDVARVDGWGWIIGDAGSAFWIGRCALEAAMRGYDGRRAATALTEVMAADFDDLELAYLELQADPNRVSRIAGYAAKVDAIAGTDLVARNILDKAAAHLSEAVVAAAHRVDLGRHEPPFVCALGQTFKSERLLEQFMAYLTMTWPTFAIREPIGTSLDGAKLLPTITDSPLAGKVVRASK